MQELLVTRLNASRFDVSLEKAWQLFKHHAQRLGIRPAVRFSAIVLPAYYATELVETDIQDGVTLKTSLSALSGNNAVMPRFMYKQALTAKFDMSDEAPLDFFDIFNNRYFRLLCQSEQKQQLTAMLEEELFDWNLPRSSITQRLSSLSGCYENTDDIPKQHLVQYTALLGLKLTCPFALTAMLEDYFSAQFEIESSALEYLPLTRCSLTQIGKSGKNRELGIGAFIGQSTPMLGQKLIIKICPQSYQDYLEIHQNKKMIRALSGLVRQFMGVDVKFNLYMKVRSDYLPRVHLSGDARHSLRLGQSAWMGNQSNKERHFVEMPLKTNEAS